MTSNCAPSSFLVFPNEIIRSVFDYLSPRDLLESFGYLSNRRLQSLIAIHISPMKLSLSDSLSLGWLKQHLSIVRQHVRHISIEIESVQELLKIMPVIDTLTLVYDEDTQHLVNHFVIRYQGMTNVHIGALILETYDGHISSKATQLFLGGNGRLPEHTLIIDSCLLQIDLQHLPTSQLRHANFIVEEEKFFHALCAHMPSLETIQIAFIRSGLKMETSCFESFQPIAILSEIGGEDETSLPVFHPKYTAPDPPDEIAVVAPVHLRSIVIKGHIATFDRLSRLFELSSASLKSIKMKVFAYSVIDPEQINNIPPHIDFRFDIQYDMIDLPQGFDWQNYVDKFTRRPVFRREDKILCDLSSIINRSSFWLQTTKICVTSPQTLRLAQVHTLKFQYCQITMNTETVKFIQRTFPQLHTLVWRLSKAKVSTKIPLDAVNTLVIHSEGRGALESLLILCPNVNQVRFTQAFEQIENLPSLKDPSIQETCKKIQLVQLVPDDSVTKQQINELFPNANVTYDAKRYYESRF